MNFIQYPRVEFAFSKKRIFPTLLPLCQKIKTIFVFLLLSYRNILYDGKVNVHLCVFYYSLFLGMDFNPAKWILLFHFTNKSYLLISVKFQLHRKGVARGNVSREGLATLSRLRQSACITHQDVFLTGLWNFTSILDLLQ